MDDLIFRYTAIELQCIH